jgi:inosine/xanthosine triphosphate pyrophosphatase family protein
VTGNKHKLMEVQAILKGTVDLESHKVDRRFKLATCVVVKIMDMH